MDRLVLLFTLMLLGYQLIYPLAKKRFHTLLPDGKATINLMLDGNGVNLERMMTMLLGGLRRIAAVRKPAQAGG